MSYASQCFIKVNVNESIKAIELRVTDQDMYFFAMSCTSVIFSFPYPSKLTMQLN